ncbi:uncharacterized protein YALI1_F22940g [Yarrowia lipolytica]|uniref:Uncharacterized protein n=1 Tax=Yarrowia lipolytica TaxID=4952 RepID=A0A1D8NNW7_YARLL|nr:hypothetical protein YALI1_F22940g [Yarrowia lipolytica]
MAWHDIGHCNGTRSVCNYTHIDVYLIHGNLRDTRSSTRHTAQTRAHINPRYTDATNKRKHPAPHRLARHQDTHTPIAHQS